MKLDTTSTPQSEMRSPLPPTSDAPAGTSKKRKSKSITQDKEVVKEVEEVNKEAYQYPQRDSSPPPAPELEEVPSSNKDTTKKGRNLHFSSSPSIASTKVNKPFTKSSALKGVVEAQVLPKVSILKRKRDKRKGIEKPIKMVDRAPE
jgi:hypothetical protein